MRMAWILLVLAACGGNGALQEDAPKLSIGELRVVTDAPQAGHPIEVRTTILTEEEAEDVAITYYLSPMDAGNEDDRTVLDSVVENVVRTTVVSEAGKEFGHEIIALMNVPESVEGGEYYVYASLMVLPTSNLEQSEVQDWDGEENQTMVQVGDDLKNTPDLVIADIRAKTDIILLGLEEDMDGDGDDPPASHWIGTALVTAFGGAQVEDVTVSALLEIPGKPLRPLKIWNTHEHVQVWRNDGTGRFRDSNQRLRSAVANAVALGDLDGDGDLDLVAANGNSAEEDDPRPNRVWFNNGNSGFTDSDQALGGAFTYAVALGDLDGDGDLDLVTGNEGEADRIWMNQGRGFFALEQSLGEDDTYAAGLADVDGDGDLDLVTAGSAHAMWRNDGNGNFSRSSQDFGGGAVRALALGDLDGDGDPDLVLGGSVWRNEGGVFSDTGADLGDVQSLALGDLDRDTDLDLAVGLAGGGVQVWRNGGGVLAPEGAPFGTTLHSYGIALGDVDGDGLADIVAGNDGDGEDAEPDVVWRNLGFVGGVLAFERGQDLGGSDTRTVALGNLDDDEDLDLVSGNLGLPDRMEGSYEDSLVLPALAPNAPTRVQVDLHIPEILDDGTDLYQEIRDRTDATRDLRFNIILCLDRFDDIPEYEASSSDPLRPNDNCVTEQVIILPPP